MFGSIALLLVLPWLDTSEVRSARFRPLYRLSLWLLVVAMFMLGYAGSQPAEGIVLRLGQLATAYYFAFFLVIVPLLGKREKTLPLPKSIHEAVLKA